MKAAEWIDRIKAVNGWDSDYKVAKALAIRPQTISMYRAHGTTLDDAIAMKVAAALGEAPEVVLIDQAAERTKNEAARSALSEALRRLGGVAATVAMVAGIGAGMGAPAPASASDGGSVCILRKVSRRRRGVLASMADALMGPRLAFA